MGGKKQMIRMSGRGPIPAVDLGSASPTLTADEFAERFRDAARVLWSIAAGVLGDSSEADDVLQEACLMALQKLEQYERGTNFAAWMGRFVRNVALNHARKTRRRATPAIDPEWLAEESIDGVDRSGRRPHLGPLPIDDRGGVRMNQNAFDDVLMNALQSLGSVQRACLLLRTVLELSYREIAATLEIPEGTAMSHVHRARTSLREHLAGDGGLETRLGNELERLA